LLSATTLIAFLPKFNFFGSKTMSIACGADPFFVGSDILDIGTRKHELRARRNRIVPPETSFVGIPSQMIVPNVPNVGAIDFSLSKN
jgi:hypothetical protein